MNKKGVSTIIVTIIMITLVLAAVGVIWVIVQNILQSGTEDISVASQRISLEIQKVKTTNDGIDVQVRRNQGKGDLVGLKFIVSDGVDTQTFDEEITMGELDTKTFGLDYTGFVKSVEVAPILQSSSGKESIGNVVDKEETKYYASCLNILNSGASVGDNTYTIDIDGFGEEKPIEVYCDMTTDGGGWTRFLIHHDENGLTQVSREKWDEGIDFAAKGGIKEWLIKTYSNPSFSSETGDNFVNAWVRDMPSSYAGENFEFFKFHSPQSCGSHRYYGTSYGSSRIISGSQCTSIHSSSSPGFLWGEHNWCGTDSIGFMWIDHCGSPQYHLLVVNADYVVPPRVETLIGDISHTSGAYTMYDDDGGTYEFFFRE